MAQDPFLAREEPEVVQTQKPKTTDSNKNLSYAPYRERFIRFCSYLVKEGHLEHWNKSVNGLLVEKDSCAICRQFYKSISCKAKVDSEKALTYPSTELLAVTSEIYREIAVEEDLAITTTELLIPLFEQLNLAPDRLSRAYFEILSEYMKVPLDKHLKHGQEKVQLKNEAKKQQKLEQMF